MVDMVERILVLGPSWLGDAVMAIPTYRELRRRFPRARIAVLARRAVAGLYPALPEFDDVFTYDRPRGVARFVPYLHVVGRMHGWHPDLALILPRSVGAAWTALLSGAPRRIGFAASGRSFLLTEAVPRAPELLRTHRVHAYQSLLAPLGGIPEPEAPAFNVPADARAGAARLLEPLGERDRTGGRGGLRTRVAFNPGATYGAAKQWPEERFVALGRQLHATCGADVVLVGGPGDRGTCDRIAHGLKDGDPAFPVLDLSGRTSILELGAVLQEADVVVSNDTGAMHVAQAVGARIVAIFGPTDPVTTAPYGDDHVLIREPVECAPCLLRTCPIDHRCMTRIPPERVLEACVARLGVRTPSPHHP